jgi:hypothetical protein
MPRPAFCIVVNTVRYCPSTDAAVGNSRKVVEYCETASWAHYRAGELNQEAHKHGEDAFYDVAPAEAPSRTIYPFQPITKFGVDDEIPF